MISIFAGGELSGEKFFVDLWDPKALKAFADPNKDTHPGAQLLRDWNKLKEKDNDLEGVDSRSSKRTHRTDMTGRTGATSARSVTTKKYAMNFKQQKTDLNAERKKNALLEQRLREMEAALATGGIFSTPKRIQSIPTVDSAPSESTPEKTITISTPAVSQALVLAQETISRNNNCLKTFF